ncbi:hypothetical protein DSO57_1000995 [Entomophthora muscae]|uniref:Uncharacterized protein n=1 Tax=Entomophthora muscae TaxID=34485 RepID=A0ACC2UIZ3_9FUNG|nr:hypothetical protein DSO57_1000995 [Entomophthora muscae]
MQWAVLFILPIELCERFSFVGTRVMLNQYLKAGFGLTEEEAKTYVHLFNGLICMFPIVGGAISDSYLGKYYTLVVFIILSLIGNVLLSVLSIDGLIAQFGKYPRWAFLLPAIMISLGSGIFKPCIGSLAGDQFDSKESLDKFFPIFTVVTYAGILMAVIAVPLIKAAYGYPLAYAIPTCTLLLALLVFAGGKRSYIAIPPKGEFLPWSIAKVIVHATGRKMKGHCAENWLDLAKDRYDSELIHEARQLLTVAGLFVPLVFVWMLHEQNTTEWQNQYEMMEKTLLGINVPTEACSVYGVVLSIVFLPAVGFGLFPALERQGIQISAGMRVAIGYLLILSSFVMSTSLQYWIKSHAGGQVLENSVAISCAGCVNGAWQLPQWILYSLGEAVMIPASCVLAYSNVGPKMKASSISLIFASIAMGNYVVIGMEPILSLTNDRILRQWCYVAISFFFLIVYLLLLKLWFLPKQENVANPIKDPA